MVTNGAVSHERKDQGASTVVPLRWVVAAGTARGRPSRRHYRTTFAYWHHNSYVNTRTELLVRVWLYGYEYCTENTAGVRRAYGGRTCILLWILYGNMVDFSFIVSLYVSDLPNVTRGRC